MAYAYGGSNSQQVPYVPPQGQGVSVISPQFCCPHPVDLSIVRKVMTISDGNFVVQDVNGKVVFKVKGALLSLHDRRVLLDAAGAPLLTLRRKLITAHERWEAYRGETKDLLFTAKRSSIIQLKTKLDIFLPQNSSHPDFKVDGSWLERSCVIYAGHSNTIVAQMHKRHSVQSVLLGKDNFMVTVYPNVDYAFIVAIIVILDEINKDGTED